MRPALELADIFRRHGEAFRRSHGEHLGRVERRVMAAIAACRTPALGGHAEQCADCGLLRCAYNSCRNRHSLRCLSTCFAGGTSYGGCRVKWSFLNSSRDRIRGSSPFLTMRQRWPHHLVSGRTSSDPNHDPSCLRAQGSEGWDPSWKRGISQPRFRSVTIRPGSGRSTQDDPRIG
jgi:hypothetical protein